jgi:hypothetical protein
VEAQSSLIEKTGRPWRLKEVEVLKVEVSDFSFKIQVS